MNSMWREFTSVPHEGSVRLNGATNNKTLISRVMQTCFLRKAERCEICRAGCDWRNWAGHQWLLRPRPHELSRTCTCRCCTSFACVPDACWAHPHHVNVSPTVVTRVLNTGRWASCRAGITDFVVCLCLPLSVMFFLETR